MPSTRVSNRGNPDGGSGCRQVVDADLHAGELQRQNIAYADTGGVSANNRAAGFVPAYRHTTSGDVVASCFADGSPAPVHVLEGLPAAWVTERDQRGQACRVSAEVVAGFLRAGVFYTRDDAAKELDGVLESA